MDSIFESVPPYDGYPTFKIETEKGYFEISGSSTPEDVVMAYEGFIKRLNDFLNLPKRKVEVCFRLQYFNTASSRIILNILSILENYKNDNHGDVLATWFYHADEEDMEEAGMEFQDLVDVPFQFKPYEED